MKKARLAGSLGAILKGWLPDKLQGQNQPAAAPEATPPSSSPAQLASDPGGETHSASIQPATSAAPIDRKALDNIRALQREGAPNLLSKVIHRYLDYSPQLLQTLREATRQGDAPSLQEAAHSFKSSSASLGALALAGLCTELEMMGRTNHLENAVSMLSKIEAEYEAVRVALATEL